MKIIPEEQAPDGLKYSNIFGFDHLYEMSSRHGDITRVRIFAIDKSTGIPTNDLMTLTDKELNDPAFMQRAKNHIVKTFDRWMK